MAFVCPIRPLHRVAVGVAAFFGLATIVAGGRVLLGADPGYAVFRPVLVFNTAMGVVYLAAAALIARDLRRGFVAAIVITLANLAVLGLAIGVRAAGGGVAAETMVAMTARAGVWGLLALLIAWERSRAAPARPPA